MIKYYQELLTIAKWKLKHKKMLLTLAVMRLYLKIVRR